MAVKLLICASVFLAAAVSRAGAATWTASSGLTPDQTDIGWELDVSGLGGAGLTGRDNSLLISTDTNPANVSYKLSEPEFDPSDAFFIEFEVRLITGAGNPARGPIGLIVNLSTTQSFSIYIDMGEVFDLSSSSTRGATALVETGVFQTYRVEWDGVDSYSVSQNGDFLFNGTPITGSFAGPQLSWGEVSILAAGDSEWKSFSTNAASSSAGIIGVIPEPCAAACFVVVLSAFAVGAGRAVSAG